MSPSEDDLWGAPASVEKDEEENRLLPRTSPGSRATKTDAVDTAPTRVPTETAVATAAAAAAIKRDPLTDTGRHARIEIDDDPRRQRVAFLLPLDDPNEAPDGYPIKANTKSGVYWAPGSALYDDASAEIWFATEELARVNGFVR